MTAILLEENRPVEEPAPAPEQDIGDVLPTAEVVAPLGVNLRAEPHANAALLTTLRSGTVVTLLDNKRQENRITWQYVQAGRQKGWVLNAFLKHYQ
jgi:hypothetical protein